MPPFPRRSLARLLLAVIVLPTLSPVSAQPTASTGDAFPPSMTATAAHAAAVTGKLVLMDIRTSGEWRETGVPASAHAITMHQPKQQFLEALSRATGGSKSRPIALICAVGNRSAFLQGWLRAAGHTIVVDVAEGMLGGKNGPGWIKSGMPVRQWQPGRTEPEGIKP